jgi:enoyl-CoA hydratase/carnithine racemase
VNYPLWESRLAAQSDGVIWVSEGSSQNPLPKSLTEQLVPITPQQLGASELPVPEYLKLFFDNNHYLWLFLDNPPANTFTFELLSELCAVLDAIKPVVKDKLLYISHLGDYFSLGGDRPQLLEFLVENQTKKLSTFAEIAKQLLIALVDLPALVVAVVNGSAQGGGLETLLATDIQLVARDVKVGLPEIKSGLIAGMGGLTYLSSQIGVTKTKNLILGGDLIPAIEAVNSGIISHAVDDPFCAAIQIGKSTTHLNTAIYIKQLLAHQQKETLTADINRWLDYMLNKRDWIDSSRIQKAKHMIQAQVEPRQQPKLGYIKESLL